MNHDDPNRSDDIARSEETVNPDGTHCITLFDHEGRVRSTVTWPVNRVVHVYDVDLTSSHGKGMWDDDNLHSDGSR